MFLYEIVETITMPSCWYQITIAYCPDYNTANEICNLMKNRCCHVNSSPKYIDMSNGTPITTGGGYLS